MQLLRSQLREFLDSYFANISLRAPLFCKSSIGLRFDLQHGEAGTEGYFNEVLFRSSQLFQESFGDNDRVIVYLLDYKWKRRKLRISNFCFSNIRGLVKNETVFYTLKGYYESTDNLAMSNVALTSVVRNRINYRRIFEAVANKDFSRKPALDQYGFLGNKEVYFINLDQQIIFHMYDDRGVDLIASNKEALRPIYTKFKNWILEHNRNEIVQAFES